MRRWAQRGALAAAALAAMGGAPSALAQDAAVPEAMEPFEAFASLRELDRKCRFLSFYERVDLGAAIEDARRAAPVKPGSPSAETRMSVAAATGYVLGTNTYEAQQAATKRVAAMECGSPEADALANRVRAELFIQIIFLMRHPILLDHLKKEAETAPLKWQIGNAIFNQIVSRFGDKREALFKAVDSRVQESARRFGRTVPKPFFDRLDRLIAAGINGANAEPKKLAWTYHPKRENGLQSYDWVRAQDMVAGGARMALADTLRVSVVDESGAAALSPAVGMYGISADDRILVMVNSATGQGELPDDLRATLLFRSTNPSASRWDRRSWRNGVSRVEAERLQDQECPAEACFVFPQKATDELAYIVNRPTYSLEFEVYLGAGKAFTPPQESEASQRNYLGGLITLLRDR